MDFIDYWVDIRARLDKELTRQIPKLFSAFGPQQIKTVQYIINNGKRIRGCLVCLVNHALGGQIADALPRAVAIECIQAASLIHDDYVDNDTIRRKRPATWTVEGPRRAVLLGDMMFATAIQSMVELSNADGIAVTRAIATVANGAYQEPLLLAKPAAGRALDLNEQTIYERIIYLKTGALFGAACQLGAIAAGAPEERCAHAYAFGARTGEAYQIADDLVEFVSVWGAPQEHTERSPALFPVLNFFCYKTGLTIPCHLAESQHSLHDWCQYIGMDFIGYMKHEIDARVKSAESYVGQFPSNIYGKMLAEAPAKIVAMMSCFSALDPST
ncbi:polyprenyl synthetase family protein [Nitrococcus mobilis]|uniref:Polyprenyl synthetase n=1 Tax=Nitrococcus mobilis Nb-231 TaxID=314278 RepID=A4BNM8_9GAMM|nr:polyprenyl synthetase family protein [Nitrococcus mobilis]EAR22827.1 Polyprenyl synthetase [Nitrococcus mobilis Nb-231]